MADIRFDTGEREFNINDAVTVRFCPTDMAFIERVYAAMESIDKRQDAYKAEISGLQDEAVFDLARRVDAEARDDINGIFGEDVCTPIFGGLSLYSIAGGFPVWVNFMLALIDQFEGAFAEEKKKTNPRIAKYTAKYKK